jgi:hypothetical protein
MGSDDDTVTTSAALAQARANRASVRRAGVALEGALAAPALAAPGEWGAQVAAEVEELAGAFTRHVAATEAPGGLLAEMVEISPRLAHSAERLRRDHEALMAEIAGLAGAAASVRAAAQVGPVRALALDLLRHISEHRHLGVEIVHEAYCVDIEAAD